MGQKGKERKRYVGKREEEMKKEEKTGGKTKIWCHEEEIFCK